MKSDEGSQVVLYGRSEQLVEFCSHTASVLLVTGDSGVGKSEFLSAAQLIHGRRALTSAVQSLKRGPSSLQRAIILALSESASALAANTTATQRMAERIAITTENFSRAGLAGVAKVIGTEILTAVKARIGPEFGNAIGEYIRQYQQSETTLQAVTARINSAADPDILHVTLALAEELANLADPAEIIIFLDNADRLGGPDRAQLADLTEDLPSSVKVRVGFKTGPPAASQKVRELNDRGLISFPLNGISEDAIAEWLASEGISTDLATRVTRVTHGYPLHVQSVIQALKQGRQTVAVSPDETTSRETLACLVDLPPDVARVARKLSALADPLPVERLQELVDMDTYEWADTELRLKDCGLFSIYTNGQPWFHELRRLGIWNSLGESQRDTAAAAAFNALQSHIFSSSTVSPDSVVALAEIASSVPSVIQEDKGAKEVIAASVQEISLAAAILELAEQEDADSAPFVPGDSLLSHARAKFGADGDLLSALHSLQEKGLIGFASNAHHSIVVPGMSNLASALVVGRTGRELGKLPLPRLASVIFYTLVTQHGNGFEFAAFGTGPGSAASIAEGHFQAEKHWRPNHHVSRRRRQPSIVARIRVGPTEVYCAVTSNSTDRDRAQEMERVRNLPPSVMGQKIDLIDLYAEPTSATPVRRFIGAIERITGRTIGNSGTLTLDRQRDSIEPPAPIETIVQRWAELIRLVRGLCSADERRSFGLERRRRIAFLHDRFGFFSAEIYGERDGIEPIEPSLLQNRKLYGNGPYWRFELSKILELKPGEIIGTISSMSNANNDLPVDRLIKLAKLAQRYNQYQIRARFPYNEEALQRHLQLSMERRHADAIILASALGITSAVVPHETYVLIAPSLPDPKWRVGANDSAVVVERVLDQSAAEQVHLRICEPSTRNSWSDVAEKFVSEFGFSPEKERLSSTFSDGIRIVSDLLGYMESDIELYPRPA